MKNLTGSLLSIILCVITIPTALFYPIIQIEATSSRGIYHFVKNYLVDQNSTNKCTSEIIWTCVIYIAISILLTILFYYLRFKNKFIKPKALWILLLVLFLSLQFYILQVPYYIFQIGTLYNCESDGQTGMSIMQSSPLVSLTLVLYGIGYDIVKKKGSKAV